MRDQDGLLTTEAIVIDVPGTQDAVKSLLSQRESLGLQLEDAERSARRIPELKRLRGQCCDALACLGYAEDEVAASPAWQQAKRGY